MKALARTMVLAVLALEAAPLAPPAAADNIGVIIGNRNYPPDVGVVEYAHNDAQAMRDALYRNWRLFGGTGKGGEGELHLLSDLTLANFFEWFGPREGVPGKLARLARPDADVVVFYSGHGVPGLEDRAGYLLPVDGNPDMAQYTGYPLDTLKANLEALDARSVTLLIDACFSGLGHAENVVKAISGPVSIVAKPLASESRLSVLTAASGAQVASWDEDAEHGLFTRYLLDAFAGAADLPPFGDGNGRILMSETKAWLDREMTDAAYNRYARNQTAHLSGNAAAALATIHERRPCPGWPEAMCLPVEGQILKSKMGNPDLMYRAFVPEGDSVDNTNQLLYADLELNWAPDTALYYSIHHADRPDDRPLWAGINSGDGNIVKPTYKDGIEVEGVSLVQNMQSRYEFLIVTSEHIWRGSWNRTFHDLFVGGQGSWRPVKTDFSSAWERLESEIGDSGGKRSWGPDIGSFRAEFGLQHIVHCNACWVRGEADLTMVNRNGEPTLVSRKLTIYPHDYPQY